MPNARTLNSITVKELIDILRMHKPDAKVIFASDYGDRGHTQQAHKIEGDIEPVKLTESGYSESGFKVVDDFDTDVDDDREDGDDDEYDGVEEDDDDVYLLLK